MVENEAVNKRTMDLYNLGTQSWCPQVGGWQHKRTQVYDGKKTSTRFNKPSVSPREVIGVLTALLFSLILPRFCDFCSSFCRIQHCSLVWRPSELALFLPISFCSNHCHWTGLACAERHPLCPRCNLLSESLAVSESST